MGFEACGVPLSEWEDKREKVEAALNLYAKIAEGKEKRRILLYTAPLHCALPDLLDLDDRLLSDRDFELVLGESVLGPVTVNLSQVPHILLGGSTGSGKSVLLKLLLMQAIKRRTSIYRRFQRRGRLSGGLAQAVQADLRQGGTAGLSHRPCG